jgi:hypothetical protein
LVWLEKLGHDRLTQTMSQLDGKLMQYLIPILWWPIYSDLPWRPLISLHSEQSSEHTHIHTKRKTYDVGNPGPG